MSEWETQKIGDLCDVLNGYAFQSNRYTKSGIRIIRISNVQKGYIEDNTPHFYPIETLNEFGKYILMDGDLLISLTGNVGRVAFMKKELLPAALNQRVACIRIKDDANLDKSYLFTCLNSDDFENKCIFSANGIAQKNMSTEWLKEYRIPLPPIEVQKQIADTLDKASSLIELRKTQLEKIDLLIKSKFIEMFGDPVTNPKQWDTGTIRDVVSDVKYGTSKPADEDGKHTYLRMGNITYDGRLDLSDIKHIDMPDSELDKYQVKKGDILFNRTNSKELVGKTCVFKEDTPMIIAGYIIRIKTNERANPEYVSAVLNSKYGKNTLFEMCKAIVGQANINAQEVQSIRILIPPISIQKQYSEFIKEAESKRVDLLNGLAIMKKQYKALMQEYFA